MWHTYGVAKRYKVPSAPLAFTQYETQLSQHKTLV